MVTKTEFDRTVAEIYARIDSTHADTVRQLAEGKEEMRQNTTQMNTLTQALLDQMYESREQFAQTVAKLDQRFNQLEARLENRSGGTPDSAPTQFILTQNRRGPMPDAGSKQPMDQGVQRTDRYQLPRADCPSFNGNNHIEWVRRCNSFFDMHLVPEHLKTKMDTIQFHDKASEWYDGFLMDHDPPDWPELVRLIRKQFSRKGGRNGMEELLDLRHSGSVEEYIEMFERLRSKLLIENKLFSEHDFIDTFVGGLKPDIRAFVKAFHPTLLEAAYDYALNMEGAVDSQFRRIKNFTRTPTVPTPIKPPPMVQPVRNALIDQRRALG
jgi:Retrotransposon gag protein